MTKTKKVIEPLIHLVKRDDLPAWKAWGIRAISIAASFIFVCLLSFMVLKRSPFDIIKFMFDGAFGTKLDSLVLFRELAILLIISLAVTPAFKMKFWNIGAEGQVLISAWACTMCMYYLGGKMSNGALIFIMLIASLAFGTLWAVIPAIFKARWGTNETLFTLMMNYVAIQIVRGSVKLWAGTTSTGVLHPLEYGNLPQIAGGDYALSIIIASILTLILFFYMRFSKHGYEISVVGESRNTARYIGISVPKVIIRTLVLSGILCAIAGFLLAGGIQHTVSADTVAGRGFTAVLVSWLAQFNPIAMIVMAFIVVFITKGSTRVMENCGITNSFFAKVLTGTLFLIIIACEFFIRYRVIFKKPKKKTAHISSGGDENYDNKTDDLLEKTEAIENLNASDNRQYADTGEGIDVAINCDSIEKIIDRADDDNLVDQSQGGKIVC